MKIKQISRIIFPAIVLIITASFCINCSEKDKIIAQEKNKSEKSIKADSTILQKNFKAKSDSLSNQQQLLLFVGTYTTFIHVYKMDTATGALSLVCNSPNTSNPSYLAIHPNKKWFFAVNENSPGTISAFSFDSVRNNIAFINSVSSQGSGPCYISIDKSGRFVMVANYNNGSVAVIPINSDGYLGQATGVEQHSGKGTVAGRQDGPHAHMIIQADNNFVYNTDLGINKILIYKLDTTTGKIQDAGNDALAVTGAGPRHIAFHPNNIWAYVVCELSGTVEEFKTDNSTGALALIQNVSTLPSGSTATPACADIHITSDGKYLYASNRGTANNIAMFNISQDSGKLALIGNQATNGNTPRSFIIDPTGKFLFVANQDGNNIVSFKIDSSTGKLIETGIQTSVTSPVCLKFIKVHINNKTTGIKTISF